MIRPPPSSPLFPYTTLFRSTSLASLAGERKFFEDDSSSGVSSDLESATMIATLIDRKSTRLNSSHVAISYAVFCLKKKKKHHSDDPESLCCHPSNRGHRVVT